MRQRKSKVLAAPVVPEVFNAVSRLASASYLTSADVVRRAVMKELETKGYAPQPPVEERV